MEGVGGLHHITCIAADPQENLDFYAGVLGMRLVKRSVNQDDPGTYHLFYADAEGRPGTDLTFFPWPHLPPKREGAGLAVEVALAVPQGSLSYWAGRLARYGVTARGLETRFGERCLLLSDPHGLALALVEVEDRPFAPWAESPVPAGLQVRGLHGARIRVASLTPTERFLTQVLGFRRVAEEDGWVRFAAGPGGSGCWLDLHGSPSAEPGTWGVGGVHHLAWRVRDEAHQAEVRQRVAWAGANPTPVIDRFWFKSVYFREPGGVLFELATDGPGFAVDEDPEQLGTSLVLPPWLEPYRGRIEAQLPVLKYPPVLEPVAGAP
ncbi:MAG: ring-cleaving dioxygenase [Armatimonadota bacterium]|nr:ring-cleaving dioxygenase [Armatimonadota bacterium]MDR7407197.1 ring-cleaving dioxygenase [Armatimonadota bacterium]MDR7531279.1 ring-cleaving dioxygenase [Armatimonadota bacterium]MDR7595102.1 ring-cleaving dioxygenase [Armatimonadota bacterium]